MYADLSGSDSEDDEEQPGNYRERVYQIRKGLDSYTDIDVIKHFRLTRGLIQELAHEIEDKLAPKYANCSTDLTAEFKLMVALWFYATGDHQKTIARASGFNGVTRS